MAGEPEDRRRQADVQWAIGVARFLLDPFLPAALLAVGILVAGFVLLAVAWWGVAGYAYVALQLPIFVSAGLIGLACIGTGLGLLVAQMHRRDAARERAAIDAAIDQSADAVTKVSTMEVR
jgi:membrane-bound ClpP family serine protease